MKHFDLEEERVRQEILRLGAKRVLIQLPEGFKPEAPRLSKMVEEIGALPVVSANPCYGACDLAAVDAESLGVDLIVHYGHSKMMEDERVSTVYVEARATVNVNESVQKALPSLEKWQKIGLATTVQHVQTLDTVRKQLMLAGKTVVIGDAGRMNYPGQVIGCDYSNVRSVAKDVEAFLFIGGGMFHAIGVALSTQKPTIVADPYDNRAFQIDREAERIVKQRWACIKEAQKAKSFAVVVGLKPGQKRYKDALEIMRRLEENGKTAFLLAAEEVTPEALVEFPTVEAYVNTACPRISFDDASRFRRPVLTLKETLVVVGALSWEELCREGLLEN